MSGGKPIPVRLAPELLARIDAVCKQTGLSSRSHVIKMCVSTFLDHFEATGGTNVTVPWEAILKNLDGRTHRYRGRKPKVVDVSPAILAQSVGSEADRTIASKVPTRAGTSRRKKP